MRKLEHEAADAAVLDHVVPCGGHRDLDKSQHRGAIASDHALLRQPPAGAATHDKVDWPAAIVETRASHPPRDHVDVLKHGAQRAHSVIRTGMCLLADVVPQSVVGSVVWVCLR